MKTMQTVTGQSLFARKQKPALHFSSTHVTATPSKYTELNKFHRETCFCFSSQMLAVLAHLCAVPLSLIPSLCLYLWTEFTFSLMEVSTLRRLLNRLVVMGADPGQLTCRVDPQQLTSQSQSEQGIS